MGLFRSLFSTVSSGSSGGTVTEPLALNQILTSKGFIISGIDGTGTVFQTGGGLLAAYAPSPDGTSYGGVNISKEANVSGSHNANILAKSLGQSTSFRLNDPGNNVAPIAFGQMLGALTGPYTFNGNTSGATSETAILTGTIPANTAAPGYKVSISGALDITAVNGADTLTVKVKRGATAILTVALVVADVGGVTILLDEIVQSIGASGSIWRNGYIGGTTTSDIAATASTLDTTGQHLLGYGPVV